jgi:hypothetical protein
MIYVSFFGLSGFSFTLPGASAQIILNVATYTGSIWVPQANLKINSYNLSSNMQERIGSIETVYSDSFGTYIFNYSAGSYEFEGEWNGIKNSTKVSVANEPVTLQTLHVGVGSSPPFDFWQWLTNLLSQQFVKNGLMYGGIGFIGLGSILFIIPRKKS